MPVFADPFVAGMALDEALMRLTTTWMVLVVIGALSAVLNAAADKSPLPSGPEGNPDEQPQDKDAAVKAVYAIRYGTTNKAVEAVLTDLYGPDYQAKQYQQRAALQRVRSARGY